MAKEGGSALVIGSSLSRDVKAGALNIAWEGGGTSNFRPATARMDLEDTRGGEGVKAPHD